MQVLGIDLQGRAVTQGHPGPPVEFIGHRIKLLLGVATEVRTLGEVLAQQPIGVLVATPLPRAVGVTEVHLHACVLGKSGVLGHLPAPVVGQALAHRAGNAIELVAECLQHMRGCRWIGMG